MKVAIDIKTLVIGLILGVVLAFSLGINGSGKSDFGVSLDSDGYSLVRVEDGGFYVVNPRTAMATHVIEFRDLGDKPDKSRTLRGRLFNANNSSRTNER